MERETNMEVNGEDSRATKSIEATSMKSMVCFILVSLLQ